MNCFVPRTGLKPVTCCLGGGRSIHLSYRGMSSDIAKILYFFKRKTNSEEKISSSYLCRSNQSFVPYSFRTISPNHPSLPIYGTMTVKCESSLSSFTQSHFGFMVNARHCSSA